MKRRTMRKRLQAKLREVKTELQRRRNAPVRKMGEWLSSVLSGDEIAARPGPGCLLIEYRSGSGIKTRILLDHRNDQSAMCPSISCKSSCRGWLRAPPLPTGSLGCYPCAPTTPDPSNYRMASGKTVGELRSIRARRSGTSFRRTPNVSRPIADSAGHHRGFHLNVLARLNRELGANFSLDQFRHYAFYNPVSPTASRCTC